MRLPFHTNTPAHTNTVPICLVVDVAAPTAENTTGCVTLQHLPMFTHAHHLLHEALRLPSLLQHLQVVQRQLQRTLRAAVLLYTSTHVAQLLPTRLQLKRIRHLQQLLRELPSTINMRTTSSDSHISIDSNTYLVTSFTP